MNRVFLIFLLASPISSLALVGNDFVSSTGPKSICRIVISDSKGFGICSGTLIKADQILTAAHCLEDVTTDTKITVGCGYRGFDKAEIVPEKSKSDNTGFITGVRFKAEAVGVTYVLHPKWKKDPQNFDIALINLDHPLAIQPMRVMDPKLFVKDLKCWSAGYGINKNINMGFLQVGRVDAVNLEKNSFKFIETNFKFILTDAKDPDNLLLDLNTILKYADRSTIKTAVVLFGDSGGPTFCQKKAGGELFQVGINRAIYYSRKQEGKGDTFDISMTSAFSRVDLNF